MEIILIANEKGGTAKTNTCLSLANCLTALGYKTLVVDTDPSGNLSAAALPDYPKYVLYDVLRGRCTLSEAIVTTEIADVLPTLKDLNDSSGRKTAGRPGPFCLPERRSLTSVISDMESDENGKYLLTYLLRYSNLEKIYDFIIMDSAPSDSILITNAIIATDSIIIPTEASSASANGLFMFIKSVQGAFNFRKEILPQLPKDTYNTTLNIDGFVFTRHTDDWQHRHEQIDNIIEMANSLGTNVYKTKFYNAPIFERAMNDCRPILDYMSRGFGASNAMNFTLEFLAKRNLTPKIAYNGVFKDESGQFIHRKNGSKTFTYAIESGVAYIFKQNFRLEYLQNETWKANIGKTIFFSLDNLKKHLEDAKIPWLMEPVPIQEESDDEES